MRKILVVKGIEPVVDTAVGNMITGQEHPIYRTMHTV